MKTSFYAANSQKFRTRTSNIDGSCEENNTSARCDFLKESRRACNMHATPSNLNRNKQLCSQKGTCSIQECFEQFAKFIRHFQAYKHDRRISTRCFIHFSKCPRMKVFSCRKEKTNQCALCVKRRREARNFSCVKQRVLILKETIANSPHLRIKSTLNLHSIEVYSYKFAYYRSVSLRVECIHTNSVTTGALCGMHTSACRHLSLRWVYISDSTFSCSCKFTTTP